MLRPVNWGNPINWSHPLNRGLVSWHLVTPNGQGGTRWRDLAGEFDGTLMNMVEADAWVSPAERRGGWGALGFGGNGSDDFINIGTIPAMTNWTISIWARSNRDSSYDGFNGPTLISNDLGGWNDDILFGLVPEGTSQSTTKRFACIQQDSTDLVRTTVEGTADVIVGEWNHVCITSDGATLRLYQNGALVDSTAKVGTALDFGANPVNFGKNPQSAVRMWDGLIDDVRIHSVAWSPAQVQNYYRFSSTGYLNVLNRLKRRVWKAPVSVGNPWYHNAQQ